MTTGGGGGGREEGEERQRNGTKEPRFDRFRAVSDCFRLDFAIISTSKKSTGIVIELAERSGARRPVILLWINSCNSSLLHEVL